MICLLLKKKSEPHLTCAFLVQIKNGAPFCCVDHKKLQKILKEMEYQTPLPVSWETCMQVKKQQLDPDMEQWTGSKLGKEYVKAMYCHLAYLSYRQRNENAELNGSQVGIKIAGRHVWTQ